MYVCKENGGFRQMAFDVFVSYSDKDKLIADATVAKLEARRIRCWVAPRDIAVGEKFGQAITKAISASRAVVLVFSANANESAWVGKELERAVHYGVPIFPLRLDETDPNDELSLYLAGQHWLDALTPPLEQHLETLADSLARYLGPQVPGSEGAVAGAGSLERVIKRDDGNISKAGRQVPSLRRMILLTVLIIAIIGGIILTIGMLYEHWPISKTDPDSSTSADSADQIKKPDTVFDVIPDNRNN